MLLRCCCGSAESHRNARVFPPRLSAPLPSPCGQASTGDWIAEYTGPMASAIWRSTSGKIACGPSQSACAGSW